MKRWRLSWVVASLGAVASQAATATKPARNDLSLDTQMFVERVSTDLNGRARRVLEPADRAGRGDQLIFVVNWRNDGDRPINGFAVTNPIPRGARIDPDGSTMLVSIDGGARWGRLDRLWLPTPLGGVRRALPSDVTHVRMIVADPVSPGQSGRLSYRAIMR